MPAHRLIIEQALDNGSANCGRWEVGGGKRRACGWNLAILLIPIEKDAGGSIEIELVTLLQSAPAILVGFV
ncbi:hypothetical protein EBS57_07620, partial [bacterium]|nr:hypothetical protein [bacterium]